MNTHQEKIEQLLKEHRNQMVIPSREEFKKMMHDVTYTEHIRNTQQKGITSPFMIIMNITKNKFILAGSAALLAVIVFIPLIRHTGSNVTVREVNNQSNSSELFVQDTQARSIIESSQGTVSQDIITDIMQEFSEEDVLLAQELADDGFIDIQYEIDSAIIS